MSGSRDILETIVKLRERINKYRELLSKSEALTRYVLIDPLLRALGWDTEDPEKVRPEERQGEGVPDYVLYVNGEKTIAIEAKSLGTNLDEKKILDLGFKYAWQNRIPFFIVTNGDRWDVYDLGEPGGKKVISASISKEDPREVVAELLPLWYPIMTRRKIEPVKTLLKPETTRPTVSVTINVVKCPHCGFEAEKNMFKLLKHPWKYGLYTVELLECPSCSDRFRFYYGISPRGKYAAFTIPKSKEHVVK